MNFNIDKQTKKPVLVIVLIGIVLAAIIMFWKKT
jgi:hypothetical protein